MTGARFTPTHLSLAGFLVVLAITWLVYQPATRGDFTLDDESHFANLAFVDDWDTAIDYVLTGSNGPTGRPLAMLTFAAQAAHYENGAGAFISANVAIHLLNGLLFAWFCFELARAAGEQRERAILVAVATAAVWLLLPLNATATMLAVQRMTTISAAFVFAGLAAYLTMRRRVSRPTRANWIALSAILAVTTVLATLSKETGLLVPLFVLVLESTLLSPPEMVAARDWRRWKLLILVVPALAIAAYLVSQVAYPDWMQARRGWGGWERLLTELEVLWIYLGKAIVGMPAQLGIYQPQLSVARSLFEPVVLAAAVAWLMLVVFAVRTRRRYPLPALAIFWYLVGHLLESTVLPLEIYFEHRNYVPIAGPLLALCLFVLTRTSGARIGFAVIAAVVTLNAGMLYTFASMWGEPSTSSRYWAQQYPQSVRAVTNLATYQLGEEGPQRTIETIQRFVNAHPEHGYLRIQELNLLCLYGASGDLAPLIRRIERSAAGFTFTYASANTLSDLFSTTTRTDCGVTPASVRALAGAVHGNPRYRIDPYYNQFHHKLLAAIVRHEGDTGAALDELETAMSFWPTPELNMMMVTALVAEREFRAAEDFIDSAMLDAPANPLKALAWRRSLQQLLIYTREVETAQDAQEAGRE